MTNCSSLKKLNHICLSSWAMMSSNNTPHSAKVQTASHKSSPFVSLSYSCSYIVTVCSLTVRYIFLCTNQFSNVWIKIKWQLWVLCASAASTINQSNLTKHTHTVTDFLSLSAKYSINHNKGALSWMFPCFREILKAKRRFSQHSAAWMNVQRHFHQ